MKGKSNYKSDKDKKPGLIKEDKENRAELKKYGYPLPGEKDIQYNYQPEFIDDNGNKKEKD